MDNRGGHLSPDMIANSNSSNTLLASNGVASVPTSHEDPLRSFFLTNIFNMNKKIKFN